MLDYIKKVEENLPFFYSAQNAKNLTIKSEHLSSKMEQIAKHIRNAARRGKFSINSPQIGTKVDIDLLSDKLYDLGYEARLTVNSIANPDREASRILHISWNRNVLREPDCGKNHYSYNAIMAYSDAYTAILKESRLIYESIKKAIANGRYFVDVANVVMEKDHINKDCLARLKNLGYQVNETKISWEDPK